MKRALLLATTCVLMCGAAATPATKGNDPDVSARASPGLQYARFECGDSFFGGSCPSPLRECQMNCDEGYDEDTLRCMSGAGGILLEQRAICHGKALAIYPLCLKGCSDGYG